MDIKFCNVASGSSKLQEMGVDGSKLKDAAAARAGAGGAAGGAAGGKKASKKRDDVTKEVKCDVYISVTDINDVIEEFKATLSGDDMAVLKRAAAELREHPMLWSNAEFYVKGNPSSFVFTSGTGANKFIAIKTPEGKVDAYLEASAVGPATAKAGATALKAGLSLAKKAAAAE